VSHRERCQALVAGVRWAVVASIVGLAGCVARPPVHAHPILIQPPPDAVLGAPPDTVQIAFTVPVAGDRSSLAVVASDGTVVSEPSAVDATDPRRLVASLRGSLPNGDYELIWRSVEASTSAELDGQERFRIEPTAALRPAITFSSPEVDANQQFLVYGSGFTPSTRVSVTIGDDADQLAVTSSREDGSFVLASMPVPADLPLGEQLVSARDNNGGAASSLLRVHWGGWPPLRLSLATAPGPQPDQLVVTLNARNRSDYVLRDTRLVMPLPEGASLISASPGGREDSGGVVWDVPGTIERGPLDARSVTVAMDRSTGRLHFSAWAQYGHLPERNPIWGDLPGFYSNAASAEVTAP